MTEIEKLKTDWLRMYEALSSMRRQFDCHSAIRLMCDGAILGLKCDHPLGCYIARKED